MQSPPISQVEIDTRIHSHIDELLQLVPGGAGRLKAQRSPVDRLGHSVSA